MYTQLTQSNRNCAPIGRTTRLTRRNKPRSVASVSVVCVVAHAKATFILRVDVQHRLPSTSQHQSDFVAMSARQDRFGQAVSVALRWRSFDSYGRPTCATKSAQPQRHGGQLNGQVAARANINSAHSAKWRFVAPVLSVRHQSTADMHRDEHNVTATRPSSAPAVARAFGVGTLS